MALLELLLADARTPSGSYAHSGGLEPALGELGSRLDGAAFIGARLATVGRLDATFAAAACRCCSVDALLELDLEWAARTPAPALRAAAASLGRGLLRSAVQWFPTAPTLDAYRSCSRLTPRAVVLGVVAAAGGCDPYAAARATLYDDAATVAAAAVKLIALDAATASGWLLAHEELIETLARHAERDSAGENAALPSTATPELDRRAGFHDNTEWRLFVS